MSNSVGRVDLDLGLNYSQFNKQLGGIADTATNAVGGAFKKLGGIIAAAFAVKELVGFGKAAIDLASDLDEVQNVVDVTFGEMSNHVNNFAKNALATFGLSELSAKRYASTMGAMLKSSGLSGNAVVKLSEDMTGLAADFASFYNLDNDAAFEKIRSGISGETEPLKQLGINMSVANMEAFALTQGIKKQYAQMSQAEQVLLRYNYLMSVSADAQGDFARTSNGWANQTRLLSEQWKIFQGTMGQGFINLLTPVIRGINILIQKLQVAAQYFKAFTELITGVKQEAGSAGGGAAASLGDMGDAAGGTGKAVKKAGKEVKGSLSSFDQLNVISQNAADALDDAAASAGGVGADMALDPVTAAPEIAAPDMSKFQPLMDFLDNVKFKAVEAWNSLKNTFGPTLGTMFTNLMPPLLTWKQTLVDTFSQIATLGAPFKTWFTADLIPFIQQVMVSASEVLAGLLDSANMVFTGIRDAAFPILEWFVTDGLPLITDFQTGALEVFMSLFNGVKHIFDTLWSQGVQPGLMLLFGMIVDTLNTIKNFWYRFGGDIVQGLKDAINNVVKLFDSLWTEFLKPIWDNLIQEMSWLWEKHLKGLVEEVTVFIGKLVTGALDIFNKFIVPIVDWLIKKLGPTFSNIFNFVIDVIGTALGVIIDVAKGIIKALGGIIDFIVGVFTGDWDRAWTGIKNIFGGIWDAIVGIVKGAVNIIIDLINVIVRAWNKLKFEVPKVDLGPMGSFGGWTIGMPQIPEIPKLAKGGLVDAPTLAMVGDNRNAASDPEVVSPLSKLQDMLGQSNQAVVEVLFMILDVLERLDLSVDIDGEKLTRVIRRHLNAEGGRVGRNAITVGGVPVR